jgi:hypothetical protein
MKKDFLYQPGVIITGEAPGPVAEVTPPPMPDPIPTEPGGSLPDAFSGSSARGGTLDEAMAAYEGRNAEQRRLLGGG